MIINDQKMTKNVQKMTNKRLQIDQKCPKMTKNVAKLKKKCNTYGFCKGYPVFNNMR